MVTATCFGMTRTKCWIVFRLLNFCTVTINSKETARHYCAAKLPWRSEFPGDSCWSPPGSHLKHSMHHVWASPRLTLVFVLFLSDSRWFAGTSRPAALNYVVWGTETARSIGGRAFTDQNRCSWIKAYPSAVSITVTYTGLESNTGLQGERPATVLLRTASCNKPKINNTYIHTNIHTVQWTIIWQDQSALTHRATCGASCTYRL